MNKRIVLSFDIEHDLSNEYHFWGVDLAIPHILGLLSELSIQAEFFLSTDVLLERPKIIEEIINLKHGIGNHNSLHSYLCKNTYKEQNEPILISTRIFEKITGKRPNKFRAPYFAVNNDTMNILEELEYILDSSVLPGRRPKKYRVIPILYNFKSAPLNPYHPRHDDVCSIGDMKIFEIPVTRNPLTAGAPIGGGALKYFGIDKIIEIIRKCPANPVLLLFHPWEFLENWKNRKLDKNILDMFLELLKVLKRDYSFILFYDYLNKVK